MTEEKRILEARNEKVMIQSLLTSNRLSSPEMELRESENIKKEEEQLSGSLKDLIKVKRHFLNLSILLIAWIVSSFDYYLINSMIKYLPGDFFVNALTTNAADLPLVIVAGICYQKLGIKFSLSIAFSAAALGSLSLILFAQESPNLVPYMLLFSKGGVKLSFLVCFFANSQIFPAIFAGTALGICNAGAKIATIFSPYMAEVDPPLPMIIFTTLAIAGALLSLLIQVKLEREEDQLKQSNDKSFE